MGGHAYRYGVFLSYAHTDKRWARRISRLLETWKVPRRLAGSQGAFGPVPGTLGPVFRDRDELSASAELGATINRALQESAAMVVICSPAAARSRWVNEEVRAFKGLGRGNRIFSFIIDGDPNAGDGAGQCFPPALRFQVDAQGRVTDAAAEPIAADARPDGDGPRRARLRLLAGLLGVGYDDLAHREQNRRNQRLVAITGAALVGMAVTLALAVTAWFAKHDAERRQRQAEALINYQVGILYEELRSVGRTDLLESLGDQAMDYFESLSPRDLNDEVLALQAQALTQIGRVRTEQGRFDDAIKALRQGYERSAELVARHPSDGQRLFDRAQAEFYIAENNRVVGNAREAEHWFARYRDSTYALAALDPTRLEWVREKAYGDHNLAVLMKERGDYDGAAEIFNAELETLRQLRDAATDPRSIDSSIANALSFLGSIREATGRLGEAEQYFSEAASIYRRIATQHQDRPSEQLLGDQLIHLTRVLAVTGKQAEAGEAAERALAIHGRMHEIDPANVGWARSEYIAKRDIAQLAAAAGALGDARRIYAELLTDAELSQLGPSDDATVVTAFMTAARADLAAGDHGQALSRASRAVELASSDDVEGSPQAAALLALALVERGRALAQVGDDDRAASDFSRAYRVMEPHASATLEWVVLDAFIRAALLNGHASEAQEPMKKLEGIGYEPLWPWPSAGA